MMLPATPQRTAEKRRVAPTPMIEDEMTCVVDTGSPYWALPSMTALATVCAAKPLAGVSWMMRRPSVRMMRQPPE